MTWHMPLIHAFLVLTLICISLDKAQGQSSFASSAAGYPKRPVRFIVPFPTGGGADLIGRIVAQKLTQTWGQSVVVDNRAGSGGIVGATIAAGAAPDGYTMFLGNSGPNAANISLYKSLPYDPIKDFSPVTLVAAAPNILVVNPSFPADSVIQLIALAKAKPGQLTFAFGGVGSQAHLAGALFIKTAGLNTIEVPYKGGPPAITDLIGGRVSFMFTSVPAVMTLVKAEKLKVLAVTSAQRSSALPNVPTISESLPGYEAIAWWGVLAPARTPRRIINVLNAEIIKSLSSTDVKDQYAKLGVDTMSSTPDQFAVYIKAEIAKWSKVIKDAGISPQ